MIEENKNINEILIEGGKYLKSKCIDNSDNEIEIFILHLLSCSKIELFYKKHEKLSKNQIIKLNKWIDRRADGEPVQYIISSSSFYGRDYFIDKNVFIPRPESEILISEAILNIAQKNNPSIFEIGTGSGCLSITLGIECPQAEIISIDISDSALKVANVNAQHYNVENISFKNLDFFNDGIYNFGRHDLIISNPPYIPKIEMDTLMLEVSEHEPHNSLTDNKDGLEFYRKFSNDLPYILKENGLAIFEVGAGDHPNKAKEIFNNSNSNTQLLKDYNGDNRVLKVWN